MEGDGWAGLRGHAAVKVIENEERMTDEGHWSKSVRQSDTMEFR